MNEFCLVPPDAYHSVHKVNGNSKKLAIRFCCEKLPKELSSVFESFDNCISRVGREPYSFEDEKLYSLVLLLYQEIQQEHIFADEYIKSIMAQIYIRLVRCMEKATVAQQNNYQPDEKKQRICWIENYFELYFDKPITEDHMAKEMNLSKRQVSRVLRESFGSSFRQILIEKRLHRAAQLLLSTNLPIDKIAETVGYSSISGFYFSFSQKFGISAGEYRKKFFNI